MKLCIFVVLSCVIAFIKGQSLGQTPATSRVVCYYDSQSVVRGGIHLAELEQALPFCTHLFYGYAGINAATNKLVSLNESHDTEKGKSNFRSILGLRARFPHLKFYLSVGGNADTENKEKYLSLLESSLGRMAFINSAHTFISLYGFDGIDLAWQFPTVRPKKIRSTAGSIWHAFKETVGVTKGPVDEKSDEHKEEFTTFVRDLKYAFQPQKFEISLTVLPNVQSSLYFDIPAIINNVNFVNLAAFDFQTPDRNPKEADFASPINEAHERNPESNVQFQVLHWLKDAPASKINVGISTYGRVWKLTDDSTKTGVPPILETEGPGAQGARSKVPGLLSWPEICSKLPNPNNVNLKGEHAPLRRVSDPTKKFGSYAFRLPDSNEEHGVWVSYEDPDTAGNKAGFVRAKGLGGIAIFDLSYDDYAGVCSGDKFPILRAAKYRL